MNRKQQLGVAAVGVADALFCRNWNCYSSCVLNTAIERSFQHGGGSSQAEWDGLVLRPATDETVLAMASLLP